MRTMDADRWIPLLALCFIFVSSSDSCEQNSDGCDKHTLNAALGSSVLLQCKFANMSLYWVSWTHSPEADLVHLTSEGLIKFLDHRNGRVKAFPNQGSERNYSIRIDELQTSDLGCYRCQQGLDCLQVELAAERGALKHDPGLLIYICVGAAVFLLLSIGAGCCCATCILCFNNRTQDNLQGARTEGASAPRPADPQPRGAGSDNLVYENDDQDPSRQQDDLSRSYCNPIPAVLPDPDRPQPTQSTSGIYPNLNQFEKTDSQRTKRRFHSELFSRLRQASVGRSYYVNQAEISMQQARPAAAANHVRDGEYKNPIYNRSTDQLNYL